jgi:hypothetical protein
VIALASVVVNHVEDHLDVCCVQLPHHQLELRDDLMRSRSGGAHHGVAVVRGQERDGVVIPVVPQTSFGEAAVSDKSMNRC